MSKQAAQSGSCQAGTTGRRSAIAGSLAASRPSSTGK
jgi:hypothetical protein